MSNFGSKIDALNANGSNFHSEFEFHCESVPPLRCGGARFFLLCFYLTI
jgi:hypothetical protein